MRIFKLCFFIGIILIKESFQQDICKSTNECNDKETKEECINSKLSNDFQEKCKCCWHELLGNTFCGPETVEFGKEVGKKKQFDIGTVYCKLSGSSCLNKGKFLIIFLLIFLYL